MSMSLGRLLIISILGVVKVLSNVEFFILLKLGEV